MKVYVVLIPETVTDDCIIRVFADEKNAIVSFLSIMKDQLKDDSIADETIAAVNSGSIDNLRELKIKYAYRWYQAHKYFYPAVWEMDVK